MSNLFGMSTDFVELFESLEALADQAEETGAAQEELQQAWYDTLEGMEAEVEQKAENCALYIQELEGKAATLKQAEANMRKRRASCENKAAFMRKYIATCMEMIHRKKIDGVKTCLSIRKNPDSVSIQDEPQLLEYLERIGRDDLIKYGAPAIKKTDIKREIQSGKSFPYCTLVASTSLIIK